MSNDFKEKTDVRELMTFSGGIISPNMAVKISKHLGKRALGVIRENPYVLCAEDYGISFRKADEIAIGIGISSDSPFRIESGIKYAMRVFALRDGHTYVKKSTLIEGVAKLLAVDEAQIQGVLSENNIMGISQFLIRNEPCVVLNDLYFAEMNIAKKLEQLNRYAMSLGDANVEYIVQELELRDNIKYANMQKKAIWEATRHGVTVLTGGPGTGKTTVIKALIQIYARLGMSYALCAPTGRASKRMSESTMCEAKTIHRLLEVSPANELASKAKFLRDKSNPLDEDVIIVDETSMIDIPLMNSLLLAIKPGARLILIGDTNQLPSVGEGNVLNDIIKSECFTTVCLNEIFRQSHNSGIIMNAHKINNGMYPDFTEKFDDFFFIQLNDESIPGYIADLCKNRLPKRYGAGVIEGIQVITPSKKGNCGTQNLNYVLRDEINPEAPGKAQHNFGIDRVFRVGDRVMQMKNNYEAEWIHEDEYRKSKGVGVFNGDVGKLIDIDETGQIATVDYNGRRVEYQFSNFDEIDHSYAVTVHKSQGSEYPIVIIPVSNKCPPMLLTRNLLYTAITRAAKMVIVIGDKPTFCKMIDNNFQFNRNTNLEMLLRKVVYETI